MPKYIKDESEEIASSVFIKVADILGNVEDQLREFGDKVASTSLKEKIDEVNEKAREIKVSAFNKISDVFKDLAEKEK